MTAETKNKNPYTEAVGRRKTSVARVRVTPATKTSFTINKRSLEDYFPVKELRDIVKKPLENAAADHFEVTVIAKGGGIHSQAESVALGLARVLIAINPEHRLPLKRAGSLTRDPRAKERRKFGLKKARKAPQWSKR